MKKKNTIILVITTLLLIILSGIVLIVKTDKSETIEYDYTNKIIHYADYNGNGNFLTTYIFMKNGTYFHFINQYDEQCDLRAEIGTWSKKENQIYIKYKYATYFDGGQLVETDDISYFGVRRENYDVIKKIYPYDTYLDFEIKKGQPGDKYMDYLDINSSTYYPIYEFETQDELYKKLEEMYGEVFTMLIDDSVEVQ